MKIIHTADWHLGQTFFNYDRSREYAVFLDWLCNTIKERGTELLLIAGDVFDSPNPSAESQRMYYHFLKRVTEENRNLQIIVTAGNHDSAARIEAPAPLLNIFNIHISGIVHYHDTEIDYDRMIVPIADGGCCLAVPYLRHNDHPEAESYNEGVAMMYAELYRRATAKGYSPIIAMGHLQASGATVSVGDSSEHAIIGGMEGIEAQFVNEGIAYTALGHLFFRLFFIYILHQCNRGNLLEILVCHRFVPLFLTRDAACCLHSGKAHCLSFYCLFNTLAYRGVYGRYQHTHLKERGVPVMFAVR